MRQYIDKSALIAEIEKRRSRNSKNKLNLAAAFEDNYLLSFLDTLEVKEVDFDEIVNHEDIKNAFKAGYELGMSVSNKAQKGE